VRSRGWLPLQGPRRSLRASWRNPEGAGRFWPGAASIVGHYALAWLPPLSSRWAKIDSVRVTRDGREVL